MHIFYVFATVIMMQFASQIQNYIKLNNQNVSSCIINSGLKSGYRQRNDYNSASNEVFRFLYYSIKYG